MGAIFGYFCVTSFIAYCLSIVVYRVYFSLYIESEKDFICDKNSYVWVSSQKLIHRNIDIGCDNVELNKRMKIALSWIRINKYLVISSIGGFIRLLINSFLLILFQ
ncbi:hypothetical protein PEDI_50260 [Persicobacter diffluens]|uniref:Uncharacterized protein n=1 Tax=Persicobacter diffluens TaxID=981 RepID=A0AAN4W405_9BACT|nr:hypothetical protein PEDI_50260 [Persicobacter diffluens]